MRLYLGYIPIWIMMLVIVACDVYIVGSVYHSILQHIRLSAPSSSVESTTSPLQRAPSSEASHSAKGMSRYLYVNRQVFFRFALGPFLMVILHIPGSILRLSQAANLPLSSSEESFWSYAQAVCDPMHGSINALVWVLSDRNALKEWHDFFCRAATLLLGKGIIASSPLEIGDDLVGNPGCEINLQMNGRLSLPQEYDSSTFRESLPPNHLSPDQPLNPAHKHSSWSRVGLAANQWGRGARQERHTTTSLPRSQNPMHLAGVSATPSVQPQFVTFESETEDSEARRSSSLSYR